MWSALSIVYVLWGGTYVAIRVMVEDIPPLLGAGARFAIAGVAMLAFLAARGHRVRVAPRSLAAAGLVGLLLPAGGNGLVTVAERDVPAGLAALLIASVPLWLVLMRSTVGGERVNRGTLAGVAVGFCGLALLLLPGSRPAEATAFGILLVLIAAFSWATGSFLSPRLSMPSDPLVSTAWQMVVGGGALLVGALVAGEANDLHLAAASAKSLLGFAYLVVAGSWVAFTAYAWLLQNVPISKVATYAYVNPLVAVLLGWALLSEELSVGTLAGAALIVASVATIVRRESAPPAQEPEPSVVAIAEDERCIKQPTIVDSVSDTTLDEGSDHDATGHARPARHHRSALPLARRDHTGPGTPPDPAPADGAHAPAPRGVNARTSLSGDRAGSLLILPRDARTGSTAPPASASG